MENVRDQGTDFGTVMLLQGYKKQTTILDLLILSSIIADVSQEDIWWHGKGDDHALHPKHETLKHTEATLQSQVTSWCQWRAAVAHVRIMPPVKTALIGMETMPSHGAFFSSRTSHGREARGVHFWKQPNWTERLNPLCSLHGLIAMAVILPRTRHNGFVRTT